MVRNLLEEREARARKAQEVVDAASLKMQDALERSLGDAEGLRLVVQPIVNAADPQGVPYAYEACALIRGLRVRWLVVEAAERFERLLHWGRGVHVGSRRGEKSSERCPSFVNLHPAQLGDPQRPSRTVLLAPFSSRIVFEIMSAVSADHPRWKRVGSARVGGF